MSLVTIHLDALRTALIICCSDVDTVVERWNGLLPSQSNLTYGFSDHIAHEMADFISQYQLSKFGRDYWGEIDQNVLAFDTFSFAEEVKGNYLDSTESDRVVYSNYIDYQIGEFLPKVSAYNKWLNTYEDFKASTTIKDYELNYLESGVTEDLLGRNYTRKGLTDLFANKLDRFIDDLDHIIKTTASFNKLFNVKAANDKSPVTDAITKIQWKGDKTDLAELVWALVKSGRVNDSTTGQLVTLKELTNQFETLFGLKLDVTGLMKGRMKTYKATSDGNTFTRTLSDLVNERAANS
jgi:hypothetical protein